MMSDHGFGSQILSFEIARLSVDKRYIFSCGKFKMFVIDCTVHVIVLIHDQVII